MFRLSGAVLEQVLARVAEVEIQYYRLALVIGGSGTGKTLLLKGLSRMLGTPMVNVNLELARMLIEIPASRRSPSVSRLMGQIVSVADSDRVILDNTEILFHPSLQTDPLKLFQNLSRNRTIIASWQGSVEEDEIVYAAPGWPERRRYGAAGVVTVCMNKSVER